MEQQLRLLNVQVRLDSGGGGSSSSSSGYDSDSSSSAGTSIGEGYYTECSERSHEHGVSAKRVKYKDTSPSPSTCTALTRTNVNNSGWNLKVSQDSKGIRFQTSIKSIADVAVFLTETLRYFTSSPNRTPNYHADRSRQTMAVTNKMLQVEYVLHSFFQKKHKPKLIAPCSSPICDSMTRAFIKRQLLQTYFTCHGTCTPILPSPYFIPYFQSQPNCMLSSAAAAFVAYSQCRHVDQYTFPVTRESIAESFRQEAKELLEDVLFEEEPSVITAASLMLLSQCALITLQNMEARLYMNLAWRMVVQLKDKYIHLVQPLTTQTIATAEICMAEAWRRLFYAVRYLELNLYMIYDGLADFSSIMFDSGIGYPTVLASEYPNKEVSGAILVFSHVVRLHNCQMSPNSDALKYQLFAGNLESISILDIECLENQLISFWKTLPAQFRLSDSPLEYLQTDRIQQCENPHAIYLNQLYYAYWLALETRLMRSPDSTDLKSANMERFDGDRALLIVSVCCDAISKIFHVLYCRLPCTVELHWLLIASDAMAMLKNAANPHIKSRAQKNLRVTLRVLKDRVRHVNQDEANEDYNLLKSMLPASASETSMSTSTSSGSLAGSEADSTHTDDDPIFDTRPPAAYFGELKKTMNTFFSGTEQPPPPST
ncbi:uncharacterized protein EV154DRAFT_424341 [Mucor mucedo]|uniref:uncharacterized protein n=1 Tax=Mucor mucedo TaxID=29922 RepID=UPI002220806F|nr:uncharacterized protein EV154DRAFT_424341 [Mucor mucedo]KAI7889233.1 hypothetical protein EV154DRAFT_424341 [Mucor mucedo]